jgi:aspartate/tyrosine/aromatic aminotransferase
MADRIIKMRSLLKQNLEALGSKHDWSHITSQVILIGFSGENCTDMSKDRNVRIYWLEAGANGDSEQGGKFPSRNSLLDGGLI